MKTLILIIVMLWTVTAFSQNQYSSISLPSWYNSSEIRSRTGITGDASGNLWLAFQYKGIARYYNQFWQSYNTANSPLLSDTVLCIASYNNNVYIGTNRGLSVFNGFSWISWTEQNGLSGQEIYGIWCDSQGLLVATETHLCVWNGNVWTNYPMPGTDCSGSYYFGVYRYYHIPVFRDSQGIVWTGKSGAGLQNFNGSQWQPVFYNGNAVTPTAIAEDILGRILVGTQGTTLIWNGQTLFPAYQINQGIPVMPPSLILSFAENAYGDLFFGNASFLYISNEKLNTFQLYLPQGSGMHTCWMNGRYYMLHAVSDTMKCFHIDDTINPTYGSTYNTDAYAFLDGNMVKALYRNRGGMFWDYIGNPSYEVPKGSGKHSLFAASVWLGGYDSNDSLCTAMEKYGQGGQDYFPGPLRSTGLERGTTDTASCIPYDRIWKINRWEIDSFIAWHQDGSLGTGNHTIPEAIATWPAHGDETDGFSYYLAPFVDTDTNGLYEPLQGDYPRMRGTQMLWWVYNDALAPHTESGRKPMGVEIRASAYVFGCDTFGTNNEVLNYTTFLHLEMINFSTENYHDCFAGFWTDADLGDHADDYIGCNVAQNKFFVYNGDENDGDGNGKTYGINPPCQSVVVLNGPWAPELDGIDNDRNGATDEPFESTGMSKFMYFNNSTSVTGDPHTSEEAFNYMRGRWKDGTPMSYGGTGYQSSNTSCDFVFPGNSDPHGFGTGGIPQNNWTEESENNPPGDRRGIAGMGPFSWQPGGLQVIDIAFVWSRADSGGAYASVLKNEIETEQILSWYRQDSIWSWSTGGNFPYCGIEPLKIPEAAVTLPDMKLFPNPASDRIRIVPPIASGSYRIEIMTLKGKTVISSYETGSCEVDISALAPGLYIVRIADDKNVQSRKLVVGR